MTHQINIIRPFCQAAITNDIVANVYKYDHTPAQKVTNFIRIKFNIKTEAYWIKKGYFIQLKNSTDLYKITKIKENVAILAIVE